MSGVPSLIMSISSDINKYNHIASNQGVLETSKKKFGSNRNKICFRCVSVCFMKPKTKNLVYFFSFRNKQNCFKRNRNKPKQPYIFLKIPQFSLYQTLSVGLLFFSVQLKHRNSLLWYRSETTKTNCFKTIQNKSKQTNPKLSEKIPKYALNQTVSVALLFISVQSKHRNSLFQYTVEVKQPKQTFCSVPVSVVSNRNQFQRTPYL